jgi:hypothetical protein
MEQRANMGAVYGQDKLRFLDAASIESVKIGAIVSQNRMGICNLI